MKTHTQESKHTPGPWRLLPYENSGGHLTHAVEAEHSTLITYDLPCTSSHPELMANAVLIAAAPELLAACKAIAFDSRLVCNISNGERYYPISVEEMSAIRAAIARAEGREEA